MKSRRSIGTREETRKWGVGERKESSFPRPLAASTIARAFSRGSSSLAQIGELAHRLKNMRLKGSKIKASTLYHRVRKEFWIQSSRLFPDFSIAIISFSGLKVVK